MSWTADRVNECGAWTWPVGHWAEGHVCSPLMLFCRGVILRGCLHKVARRKLVKIYGSNQLCMAFLGDSDLTILWTSLSSWFRIFTLFLTFFCSVLLQECSTGGQKQERRIEEGGQLKVKSRKAKSNGEEGERILMGASFAYFSATARLSLLSLGSI